MAKVDTILLSVTADLSINLAAGWIGVLMIVPNFVDEKGLRKWLILISDLFAAIFYVILAVILRLYEK